MYIFIIGIACGKNKTNIEKEVDIREEVLFEKIKTFQIKDGPCGKINYINRIGYNFNSALDSLLKFTLLPNSSCPNNPCQDYKIQHDTIIVDFNYDKRFFIAIVFKDINNRKQLMSISEVLDSKGNYFRINWCED